MFSGSNSQSNFSDFRGFSGRLTVQIFPSATLATSRASLQFGQTTNTRAGYLHQCVPLGSGREKIDQVTEIRRAIPARSPHDIATHSQFVHEAMPVEW
jgi:hypothetical protein